MSDEEIKNSFDEYNKQKAAEYDFLDSLHNQAKLPPSSAESPTGPSDYAIIQAETHGIKVACRIDSGADVSTVSNTITDYRLSHILVACGEI